MAMPETQAIATIEGVRALISGVTPTAGPSDFPTLATVALDGSPAVRSVVIRRFDASLDRLWVTTDARSAKVAELRKYPVGQMSIWLADQKIQLRLTARWDVIDEISARGGGETASDRQRLWGEQSQATIGTFFGPDPGTPWIEGQMGCSINSEGGGTPETFAVLRGSLTAIDALRIAKPTHLRFQHENIGGNWRAIRVNP